VCQNDSTTYSGDPDNGNVVLSWQASAGGEIIGELLLMLQNIVMFENAVYRYSPKLRDLAGGINNTELYLHEMRQLKSFIKTNKDICLEGYTAFRMQEYREKLDELLYSIMKKINM